VHVYNGQDPESKKRKYLNQTVHSGLRNAQSHLNKMLGERDRGRNLDSSKQTLNQYLDRWLEVRAMSQRSMYRVIMSYLERLPRAMQKKELPSGENIQECVYSPHSLRATTATLLLDSSVAIESVEDLLDHKHITTTRIYHRRLCSVRDSASLKVPMLRDPVLLTQI